MIEQESKKIAEYLISLAKEIGSEPVRLACRQVLKQRNLGSDPTPRKPVKKEWTKKAWKKASGTCPRCNLYIKESEATADHLVALHDGGEHSEKNLRLLCKRCNSSKGSNSLIKESKRLGKTILEQIS
jgi:5-methylcytosine-specific restriction endonuclease McrA